MPQTIVTGDHVATIERASAEGDALWVPILSLEEASGWKLKPEGVCRDEVCVPLPLGLETEFIRPAFFNLAAFAKYMDQPLLRHSASDTWVIGESADARANALRSLQAPDFTLPDLDGKMHSLSDYRGKKVFLASWASW